MREVEIWSFTLQRGVTSIEVDDDHNDTLGKARKKPGVTEQDILSITQALGWNTGNAEV